MEEYSDSEKSCDSDNEVQDHKIETKITTYNIDTVYNKFLKSNQLLLQPEYQRDLCWSYDKMNMFIDSIMKNYIVPNFVIYELPDDELEDKNYMYECIDGQHRLVTIKWFIENIKNENNKYVHWKYNNERIYYNISNEYLNDMKKKRKISCRNLTNIEKRKFNDFEMSFHMIKSSKKITMGIRCDIFNRLQNGEKMNTYERLKNLQNIIINAIRTKRLCFIIKDTNIVDKIKFPIKIPKKSESFYIFFIIRSILIIDKQSLDVNYLDLNIKKYLEANNGKGAPCVQITKDIDILCDKVLEIINWINSNNEIKEPLIIELIYIFICIYATYDLDQLDKVIKWLNENEKQLNKFNDITSYKKNYDKITSSIKMKELYDNLVKYVIKK